MNENIVKTGTTTLGLICKDGLVIAADKRATAGNYIVDKNTDKVHQIQKKMLITMAGTASDAQLLIRLAKSELDLKAIRTNRDPSVKEAANLISRMVYSNIRKMSMIPGISHFILGGLDDSGYSLYDIFPDGTISKIDNYISSGSGSVMVYGVLETLYTPEMTTQQGIDLALKSVYAALQRDNASGDGVEVFTITKDGVKKVVSKKLQVQI